MAEESKPVFTGVNQENLFISRDEFVAKRTKEKELKKRLAVESERISKEIEAEGGKDEEQFEESDELQTVETVMKKKQGRPKKVV